MTTMADLMPGDVIVVMGRVTAADPNTGDTLAMLGPSGQVQGTIGISPSGAFSGQLAQAANLTTVQLVPALAAVSPGNIMVNLSTGETMIARQVALQPDGSYQWTASMSGGTWYGTAGWRIAGTATVN